MSINIEYAKKKMIPVLQKYEVQRSFVFGSIARNEATSESDLDVIVELPRGTTLFDFVHLKRSLQKVLGKEVDLVTSESISSKLREYIDKDKVFIYEKGS